MDKILTYATVCSGIECMSVACRGLPLKPVFFSEIEPFPCAVLKAHYPDVPNLGDMSKITVTNKTEITNGITRITLPRPIDILAGGTPCQSVSVAGKGEGMREGSGTRSSLAFDFVRLARELRPRWIVWENVANVLSAKHAGDFLHFLANLGDCGYSLAWRVLDAQYVRVDGMERAVPQRRRRVWVVGCLGADESRAAEILFEPDCVAGHTAPRRRTGEGFAYSLAGCDRVDATVVGGAPGVDVLNFQGSKGNNCVTSDGSCPNLNAMHGHDVHVVALDGDKLKPREDQRKGGNGFGVNEGGAGYTLTAVDRHGVAYGIDQQGGKGGANTTEGVAPTVLSDSHGTPHGVAYSGAVGGGGKDDVSEVLTARSYKGIGARNGEISGAFAAAKVQCYDMTHADDPGRKVAGGVSPTLQYRMGTGGNQVPLAVSTNSSRDEEPLGIGRDMFNSGANASFSPDIRVGVQPTLTARTTQGAVCAKLKGEP